MEINVTNHAKIGKSLSLIDNQHNVVPVSNVPYSALDLSFYVLRKLESTTFNKVAKSMIGNICSCSCLDNHKKFDPNLSSTFTPNGSIVNVIYSASGMFGIFGYDTVTVSDKYITYCWMCFET